MDFRFQLPFYYEPNYTFYFPFVILNFTRAGSGAEAAAHRGRVKIIFIWISEKDKTMAIVLSFIKISCSFSHSAVKILYCFAIFYQLVLVYHDHLAFYISTACPRACV